MISQIRYFRCLENDYNESKKFFLMPHLVEIRDSKKIAQVGDVIILSVLLGSEAAKHLYSATGVVDIFDHDNITALSLDWYYIGRTIDDIIALYPELEGQEHSGTDEEGNPVMVDKINRGGWYGFT